MKFRILMLSPNNDTASELGLLMAALRQRQQNATERGLAAKMMPPPTGTSSSLADTRKRIRESPGCVFCSPKTTAAGSRTEQAVGGGREGSCTLLTEIASGRDLTHQY